MHYDDSYKEVIPTQPCQINSEHIPHVLTSDLNWILFNNNDIKVFFKTFHTNEMHCATRFSLFFEQKLDVGIDKSFMAFQYLKGQYVGFSVVADLS